MKKIISVLLSAIICLTCFIPFTADAAGSGTPIVYCPGQGSCIRDGDGNIVYPISIPDGYITSAVKDCMPDFLNAITSDDWSVYREKLLGYIKPLYEKIQLDGDGSRQFGTHVDFYWSQQGLNSIAANARANGKYGMYDFTFSMDWRISPYETAELLNDYINGVLVATGAEKVNIVVRCQAAANLLAYMDKYGCDKLNCVEFYSSSVKGQNGLSAFFSGNAHFDSESLLQFLNGKSTFDVDLDMLDPAIMEFVYTTIEMMRDTYSLDVTVAMLNTLLPKLYDEVLYDCIMCSYGTFSGIMSMLISDDYEKAVNGLYGDKAEYKGIKDKVEYYNTNVRERINEILLNAKAAGVKIATFSKYGDYVINMPMCKNNWVLNDASTTTAGQSFGATTADMGETLSDTYISKAKKNGTDKYISADNMIDASTCLFPDTSWFFCNCIHNRFPASMDDKLYLFFEADGNMTVFSNPDMPQYMYVENCNNNYTAIRPLTVDDTTMANSGDTRNFSIDNIHDTIMKWVELIKNFFVERFYTIFHI